jgi:hypothetical protein
MGRALSLLGMVAITLGVVALTSLRSAARSPSPRPTPPPPRMPPRRFLLLAGPAYHMSLSLN